MFLIPQNTLNQKLWMMDDVDDDNVDDDNADDCDDADNDDDHDVDVDDYYNDGMKLK